MEIKPEAVSRVIFAARQLNVDEEVRESLSDEDDVTKEPEEVLDEALVGSVHQEHEKDPVWWDLKAFIDDMPADEQCELIALAWIGRGDGGKVDWEDMVRLASERRSDHTAEYLIGMPLLAEYLQSALDTFDISIEDFEENHI